MRNRAFTLLSGLTLLAALTACGEKIDPGTTAAREKAAVRAPVETAAVTQSPFFYEAVATISARTASTVSSKLSGTVMAVHVREGDMVREGDLLVTLDERQVAAQMDRAEAALREARRSETSALSALEASEAAAQLAQSTFRRYQQLLKENSVSRQEFDEIESRHLQAQAGAAQTRAMLEAARSRVQQAEAGVREAGIAKRDARVRAPYAGQIVKRMIEVGDLAAPGTPFFTIEQEGVYCADLVLPERHIQEIKIGQEVKVAISALDDLEVSGTVGRIIPSADAASRSFDIKVALPAGVAGLKSGMFARVFIPIGGTGLLLVPQSALVNQGQLTGLYVVDDQQIARFRLVRLGRSVGDRHVVISGLAAGQRYISAVPPGMQDGVRVERMP